jgi:hypothetical protein
MEKWEVVRMIRMNKNPKNVAITLLMDFLLIEKWEAEEIYENEIAR